MLGEVFRELLGEVVERVGVLTQLLGGAREGLGDAGPELGLQHREHPLAHSHPRVGRVVVLRVEPRVEPRVGAELHGRRPTDAEQRPPIQSRHLRHTLHTRRAASARQPQQHGLGLVVEGVTEQHGVSAGLGGDVVQGRVAGGAGGGLRSAVCADGDGADDDGAEAQGLGLAGGLRCGIRRPGLEAVVDDDGARAQPGPRCLERGGHGERERVGAAAEGHENEGGIAGWLAKCRRFLRGRGAVLGCEGPSRGISCIWYSDGPGQVDQR